MGAAVSVIELGNAEWAGRDAIATPIADVVLDDYGPELGADDGAGRTRIQATGMDAVLADVAEHEPGDAIPRWSFDERYVAPCGGSEIDGVVITVSSQREGRRGRVTRQLIPLLARHLARFAANADGRIGEKSECCGRLRHCSPDAAAAAIALGAGCRVVVIRIVRRGILRDERQPVTLQTINQLA